MGRPGGLKVGGCWGRAAMLTALAAWMGGSPSSAAGDEVTVGLTRTGEGAYRVTGSMRAKVPLETAWGVLSDYETIGGFVGNILESRVVSRDGNGLVLDQKSSARFLVVTATFEVSLLVRERPRAAILFEDVLGRDFERYAGGWYLAEEGDGTRIRYEVELKPKGLVPAFVRAPLIRGHVKRMLEEVRREMSHRREAERLLLYREALRSH